jgi:DNA-binding transcriptional LysR family regulator
MSKNYSFDKFRFMDILPKELGYFLELAQHLNISKAAESLGIQQSGLSRALMRLEDEIGQPLFVRKNTGLILTPAGDRLLVAVRNTKNTWETEFGKAAENSELPAGLLKIGFHPSLGQMYFSKVMNVISKKYPNLEVEVHTLSSLQVARKINELEIDIGIVATKIQAPDLYQKKVGTDFVACFQRDQSDIPKRVLFNPDMQFSSPILKKYSQIKKVYIKDYHLIADMCAKTGYMGILPHSVAQKYPYLHQVGGVHLKADVSCIIHVSRFRTKSYKTLFETIADACLEK